MIERTKPMKIHKNNVIYALEKWPEDLDKIFVEGAFANAEEAIEFLRQSPHQWIVGGRLCE